MTANTSFERARWEGEELHLRTVSFVNYPRPRAETSQVSCFARRLLSANIAEG